MICLDHVSFAYDTKQQPGVIHDLSLTLHEGEYIALTGSNASGKSTLAKLMNGLLLPQTGSVTINGMDTRNDHQRWQIRQHVGMIFQNPENQLVAATVVDDVAFGPENLGIPVPQMKERIQKALLKVNMWEQRHLQPQHLSGGQKQRIAIAGILAMQPQVMIFDEATSMLDPQGRKQILSIMKELHAEGFTILHITHDLEEALSASRMIVMHQGTVVADGEPQMVVQALAEKKDVDVRLQLPFVWEATQKLREYGLPLADSIHSEGELKEALWTLQSGS